MTKIHDPMTWLATCAMPARVKVIVMFVANCRLRRHTCQPSWRALASMTGTGTTTLAKDMKLPIFREYLQKVRRGKKQTNFYRLKRWLWDRLTVGRKVPHVKGPQGDRQPPPPGRPCNLLELYAAVLAKAG